MTSTLRDLLGHQFWADAELWKAIRSHDAARDDKAIRDRLHHIHQVQRFFMWAIGDRATQPALTTQDDYPTIVRLEAYAREAHDAIQRELDGMNEHRAAEPVTVPW